MLREGNFHLIPSCPIDADREVIRNLRSEWVRVYKEGPFSCMKGSESVKAYVYPGNGIALAYVEDSNKVIVARCIVLPERKIYICSYGKPKRYKRYLENYLVSQGYSKGNLLGCKLALLKDYYLGQEVYRFPSIDGEVTTVDIYSQAGYVEVAEDGELDLDESGDGLFLLTRCCNCGALHDYRGSMYLCRGKYWCGDCAKEHLCYAYCPCPNSDYKYYQDFHPRSECLYLDGDWYLNDKDYLAVHEYFPCEHDGKYYYIDELVEIDSHRYYYHNAKRLGLLDRTSKKN